MTMRQNWRFRPSPPASVLTRTVAPARKRSRDSSFSRQPSSPWNTAGSMPTSRSAETIESWVERNWVKTMHFSPPRAVMRLISERTLLGSRLASAARAASTFRRRASSPSGLRLSFSSVARAAAHEEPISFCSTTSVK